LLGVSMRTNALAVLLFIAITTGCSHSSSPSSTLDAGGVQPDGAAGVADAADGSAPCNDLEQLGAPVQSNRPAVLDGGTLLPLATIPDGTSVLVQWGLSPAPTSPITVRWTVRVAGSRMDSLSEQVGGASQRASWNVTYASAFWHTAPP